MLEPCCVTMAIPLPSLGPASLFCAEVQLCLICGFLLGLLSADCGTHRMEYASSIGFWNGLMVFKAAILELYFSGWEALAQPGTLLNDLAPSPAPVLVFDGEM